MSKNMSLLKNKSILFAEDDAIARVYTEDVLGMLFDKVYSVSDGEEAYRIYKEKLPDIIITDIKMPREDGLSFARRIRRGNYNIPIILLTSFSEKEMLMSASNLSIDGYLVKPVELEKLTSSLCTAIQRSHKEIGVVQLNKELVYHSLAKELYRNGSIVVLGEREHALLSLLIVNANKTLTKEEIEAKLWPLESIGDSVIKKLIFRLREKLKADIIISVRGVGYRLENNRQM